MPKPLQLIHETTTPPPVPQAAQVISASAIPESQVKRQVEEKREPLQVRWPAADVKAVKRAALEADQTVSDFMLACFHACMNRDTPT
jgi:hypothetical protein